MMKDYVFSTNGGDPYLRREIIDRMERILKRIVIYIGGSLLTC